LYCCGCFYLLGPAQPSDDEDPLVAPHEATVTCLACDAVAHLSCIDYSTDGLFICPVCLAAAEGRPFSYAPSCKAPLDKRGARIILLSARVALKLLKKEGDRERAIAESMAVESAATRKEAYRALSLALGVDTKTPSTNKHFPLPKNLGKEPLIDMAELDLGKEPQIGMERLDLDKEQRVEMAKLDLGKEPQIDMERLDLDKEQQVDMAKLDLGKEPQIDMERLDLGKEPHIDMAELDLNEPRVDMTKLDLNEPAPPPSPGTLEVCTEAMASNEPAPPPSLATLEVCTQAMASNEPPPPSMIRYSFGMDGLRRVPAAASSEPPPPSMATFLSGMQGFGTEFRPSPLALATLKLAAGGFRREPAIPSTEPPLPSMAAVTTGMEGFRREFATTSKVPPPRPQTLRLFTKDNDEEE
jgi:hypothetical protein